MIRRPLSEDSPTVQLLLRITEADREKIKQAADQKGVSLAEFVRRAAVAAAKRLLK